MIKMSSFKFFMIFVFLLSLSSTLFTFTSAALPTYLYHSCSDENFTRNSAYQSNLNDLLSSLPSKANGNGFSNATAGQVPNRVYGLFQCRGDVPTSTCQDCMNFASNESTQRCPDQKGAVLWYDECLLHYNASDFFSAAVQNPGIILYNTNNVTIEPYRFRQLMLTLITEAATQAADDPKRFATRKGASTTSQTLYSLAQCTQDLSNTSCFRCLQRAISDLPEVSIGGRVLFPNCYCRFEIYPFYVENETLPPALPPSPPPSTSPPVTRTEGKSRISSSVIVAIVVPVTVSVLLFGIAGYCFLTRRARKKYNVVPEEIGNLKATLLSSLNSDLCLVVFTIEPFSEKIKNEQTKKDKPKPLFYPNRPGEIMKFTSTLCFDVFQNSNLTFGCVAGNEISTIEALQFDFGTIQAATKEFSTENKLGEGGFGEVYKGVLSNGQVIAVKRLSKNSGQGAEQFKNEVVLVAKLQHRNLVRLLGFCLEGEEKILVYEFVPNKSLDCFLFDPEKQRQLDWSRRHKIIIGIARGILYLHEDSRLKIIHRDLKTSNVLLDSDMNPKISDFGVARIFGVDQTQGNTSRVVGTYGYMAPEYAMHGLFSVKSDVYSFGVLVLEIITGKKNSSFNEIDGVGDLLSYVWKHWREETPLELLDSNLIDSYSKDEVIRCIQLGLLCVQEDPDARPTMANVVLMLNSYSISLQSPQQPAFFVGTGTDLSLQITKETDSDQSKSKSVPWSVDDASITEVYPR